MILWADGFDHYGVTTALILDGAWAEADSGVALTTDQARTGTHSIHLSSTGSMLRRVFGGPKVTAGVAAAFYPSSLPGRNGSRVFFSFRDAGNGDQISISMDSTGTISAYRGTANFGTLLGTSSDLITAAAWSHVEAKVKIDNSAGFIEVRLNGVTVLNLTGIDTQFTANAETSQVMMGTVQNDSGHDVYMDDVVAWDTTGAQNNDFIGDRKVFTDFPDADTADVAWTPDSGSNRYSRINENPPDGDTSYDTSSTTGDKMGVTFPDLLSDVVSISAVILVHKSRKTDAGDCNIQLHAQSASATADGTDRPMTTAYTLYHDVFELDPNTSAPWGNAAASAIAMQVERTL